MPLSPVARRTRRPSWLDLRLILGVVLVLAAVLAGATVMSSADHRRPVWALSRDVAAGKLLQSADLRVVDVQLGQAAASYLPAGESILGRAVNHAMTSGQLIPRAEVGAPGSGVVVSVPVRAEFAPRVSAGDRLVLWLSTKTCRGLVLLSGVTLQDVRTGGSGPLSSSATVGLTIRVSAADAGRVASALDLDGAVVRIGVLPDDSTGPVQSTDLGTCSAQQP